MQLYEILTVSNLHKVKNSEILEQFVRADKEIKDQVGSAPITLAQALRNAIREVNA